MRILYLCKRQYMGHDVIVDKYARLYEQPYQLAQLGNDVLGVCLSYRNCSKKDEIHTTDKGSLRWIGLSSGKSRLQILFYPTQLLNIVRNFKPDIIVGASDCLHVVLAYQISKKINVKFAVDLYDHFESFGLARIPFLKYFYKSAIRNACAVTCVSEPLMDLIKNTYKAKGKVLTLHSTIDKDLFYYKDKQDCRKQLGLPLHAQLIGTAGGLSREKGIEPIYNAFLDMKKENENLHLVLAGIVDSNCPPPSDVNVHYLGKLPHKDIATLFCALDVGIVYLRDTPYGRYSFPQKVYEIAACKIPFVVTNVGIMSTLFEKYENFLYEPDDNIDLAVQIKKQLSAPCIYSHPIPDWKSQAKALEELYGSI